MATSFLFLLVLIYSCRLLMKFVCVVVVVVVDVVVVSWWQCLVDYIDLWEHLQPGPSSYAAKCLA